MGLSGPRSACSGLCGCMCSPPRRTNEPMTIPKILVGSGWAMRWLYTAQRRHFSISRTAFTKLTPLCGRPGPFYAQATRAESAPCRSHYAPRRTALHRRHFGSSHSPTDWAFASVWPGRGAARPGSWRVPQPATRVPFRVEGGAIITRGPGARHAVFLGDFPRLIRCTRVSGRHGRPYKFVRVDIRSEAAPCATHAIRSQLAQICSAGRESGGDDCFEYARSRLVTQLIVRGRLPTLMAAAGIFR